MATITEATVEDIRSRSQDLGVEFYFAQFVDMYGRPSAKLVPAAYLDDLVSDGAGFAGFAAGGGGPLPGAPPTPARSPPDNVPPAAPGAAPAGVSSHAPGCGGGWGGEPPGRLRRAPRV